MSEYSLLKFYILLDQWIKDGFPVGRRFSRQFGLCTNLGNYVDAASHEVWRELAKELSVSFVEAGLDIAYPFNISVESYSDECSNRSIYQNQARLDWIAKNT